MFEDHTGAPNHGDVCRERPAAQVGGTAVAEAGQPANFGCPAGCRRVDGKPYCVDAHSKKKEGPVPCRAPVQHRKESCFQACWAATHHSASGGTTESGAKVHGPCDAFCGKGGACCRHLEETLPGDVGACAVGNPKLEQHAWAKSRLGCEGEHCCVAKGPWCVDGILGAVDQDSMKAGVRTMCCDSACKSCGIDNEVNCTLSKPGCCPSDILRLRRVCVGPKDVNCVVMVDGGIQINGWAQIPPI